MDEKRCPYPGLRPFNEEEAIFFKGRDLQVRQITKQLEERKIIMITGASGDGKSSLVYAGLIPSARAGFFHAEYNNWLFVDFKPERNPLQNISDSLASQLNLNPSDVKDKLKNGFSSLVDIYKSSPYYIDKSKMEWQHADDKTKKKRRNKAGNLFILADQFEEFFTNNENFNTGIPSENAYTAVNLLLETATIALHENLPIYIVITMRSDFISQCVAFKGLPETIGYSQFFVPRLKRNEIKQIIEEPALLSGGKIANRLSEILINELHNGFDQLPLLQHALHQLWELAENGKQELDIIHLAKLAGIPASFLISEDKEEFDYWFNPLPSFRKKYFAKPELTNVLNSHANLLYETAHHYYNRKVLWAQNPISQKDAKLILKVAFQSLTKIDDGRAVRNRMSLKEITHIINRKHITYDVVCGVLNVFRLPDSTFIRPFINMDDMDTQYIAAETILDITHEALIRNWQVLKTWEIEEENNLNDFLEFKVQLNRWIENNKSKEYLLTVGSLNYFEEWHSRCNLNPYWVSKYDFTSKDKIEKLNDAIVVTKNSQQYIENSRVYITRMNKAIKRRKNIAVSSALVVIIILSGFMAWALQEKSFAQQQEYIANEQKTEAQRQREQALSEKNKAITANNLAKQERTRAEENAAKALESKKLSDKALAFSERMRLLAQRETTKAQLEKQRADEQREIAIIASDSAKTLSILSTAQSLAFKAQQNYNDKQLNLIAAWNANYFNNKNKGPQRDAIIYEGLRYALEVNGLNNTAYTSKKKLCALSHDKNNSLLTFATTGELKALDATNFTEKSSRTFPYKFPANRAVLIPDYLIVSYEDGTNYLWNRNSGKSQPLSSHSGFITDAVRIDNHLVTASRDKSIQTWDLTNIANGPLTTIPTNSRVNVLAVNGLKVYAGLFSGDLISFDCGQAHYEEIDHLSNSISALNFNRKSKLLIAGTSTGKVRVFNTQSNNRLIHEISNNETFIESIATDENSNLLAIASSDKVIQVFDILNWQKKPLILSDHNQNTEDMLFNSQGLLIVNCADNSIRIWETDCQKYADKIEEKLKRKPSQSEWKEMAGNTIIFPN